MKYSILMLLELMNELLDIRFLESGEVNFSNDISCSLAEVVHETVDCQKLFAETKNITFAGKEDVPTVEVRGDHKRLYSVFNNIISNAVKYSSNNSTVTIRSVISPDKKHVDVHIIDTGIWIPKGDLSKIKRGFFRSENAKKFVSSGTGYGVHVSDLVVHSYGGNMKIESTEGKGTEVIIRLVIKK
jgi:signal transduction histidine kinase